MTLCSSILPPPHALGPTHTHTHTQFYHLVRWLTPKQQGQSNSHSGHFPVACPAVQIRSAFKAYNTTGEDEKNLKIILQTSTPDPGEGIPFIQSATLAKPILALFASRSVQRPHLWQTGVAMPVTVTSATARTGLL